MSLVTTRNGGSAQLTATVGSQRVSWELRHSAACVQNWRMACCMQLVEPFPEEHACPVPHVAV